MSKIVKIRVFNESNFPLPVYAKYGDAGMDLRSTDRYVIEVGKTVIVNTGLRVEIPYGYELQIRPRSGMGFKTKLRIANAPGTVDCITKNTKINTPDGAVELSQLIMQNNPSCMSLNEDTNQIEPDEITKIWSVGNKEVIRITTEDGVFECTENQLVMTAGGWKMAKDLSFNDSL